MAVPAEKLNNTTPANSLTEIYKHLTNTFVERQEIVAGMLTALVAQQHMLLVGAPGTAKSELVSEIARCIDGASYFHWLLWKFSTPDELFGPVSLKNLEQDIYKRNTSGKLPEANIGFVDEIFKSNSAILNTLLTIMNERLFFNNGQPIQVPLMTIFGASNEYPEEDENLGALYDRFLLRFEVEPIQENSAFIKMLTGSKPQQRPQISLQELQQIQAAVPTVQITQDIIDTLVDLRQALAGEGIYPTDRRWKQSLQLIQARTVLNGRNQADISDLIILKDCLWDDPAYRTIVSGIVKKYCVDQVTAEVQQMTSEAQEIHKNAMDSCTTEAGTEANKKLKEVAGKLKELEQKYPNKSTFINDGINKVKQLNQEVIQKCLMGDI